MIDVQALEGCKVLDVSTFLAGPFCATQLGEFGADVIKIELPVVGDATRRFGTMTECGDSLPWLSESRNKRCITLDLRKPDGAALLKRLVAESDVMVENFQPGTLEKWGLGYDVLSAVNPRLIMVRISGYGQTGPYKDRPGFGRIGNAFGGLSFLAGYPDRAPVTPGSATIPDYMAGLYGALGTLLALQAREKTERGQIVDIGLYEPIFRILDELAPAFAYKGYVRQRMGPGTVNVVPHSHYPTRDGRWIAIACTNDKIFAPPRGGHGPPRPCGGRTVGQAGRPGTRPGVGRRNGRGMDGDAGSRGPDGRLRTFASPLRTGLFDRRNIRGPAIRGAGQYPAHAGPACRRTRCPQRGSAPDRNAREGPLAGCRTRRA